MSRLGKHMDDEYGWRRRDDGGGIGCNEMSFHYWRVATLGVHIRYSINDDTDMCAKSWAHTHSLTRSLQ